MKRQFLRNLFYASFVILLSCISTKAQTYQWKSLPMGGAGFVSGIITSRQEQNLMYCRTDVGGAYRWNATNSSWIPLLDWASATQDGFYGVESIAIDPHATNKVYLYVGISYFDGGKTAILKSDDYGQTFSTIDVTSQFKAHGNGMGRSNGERLQVDPNLGSTLYVGTRFNGLWQSTNSGLTWSRLNGLNINTTANGNGISFVLIDPTSGSTGVASQTIYVGVSRVDTLGPNLFKSTDGGITFNGVSGGPATFMPQRATLTSAGELIINYANGSGPYGTTPEPMNNGGIFKYNPVSATWSNITPSGISRAWGGLSVDPNNPNRMIASTINNYQLQYGSSYGDRIYLTTNGGSTWTDVVARGFSLNANGTWIIGDAIHWAGCIEFDPFNTSKVFVNSGNGVFSNDNIDVAATQWKFDVKGLEETVPLDIVSIPGGALFSVIGDYDGFKHTDLNQYGERLRPTMGTTSGIAYAANNINKLVRVGSKMYYTLDQGATWIQTAIINGNQGKVALSADGNTILHCPNSSTNTTTFYSTNNGNTWSASNIVLSNATPVADMVNASKFYIYNSNNGNFNVSTDGGATFTVSSNIGSGGSRIIRTVPGIEGDIWVAMYGSGLKRSINSGTSFTTIAGVQRCSAIGLGKAATGASYFTLYMWGTISGVTGLFRSIDEGATWLRINDDMHQFGGPGNGQFVIGDMNNFGNVYMSTVGRGVVAGLLSSALPISLSSFNVREIEVNNKHMAQLTWKTASESNAGYFNVERSITVRDWKFIQSVSSKAINGNSNSLLNYDYADDVTGMTGIIYYRLKMVDNNGRTTYSSIASIHLGNNKNKFSVTVLPNPAVAKQSATVRFISDQPQNVILKVIAPGGAILSMKNIALGIGSTNISLPEAANYPSGVYTLHILSTETNHNLSVLRFVIQ